jgi:hypothetical protein
MSEHPDVYSEPDGDDGTVIVANKEGRRVLNEGFEKPAPRWNKVTGSDYLKSPKYLCLAIENGPLPQVMLSVSHQAGLRVMFMCAMCSNLHVMDDAMAERFLQEAQLSTSIVH